MGRSRISSTSLSSSASSSSTDGNYKRSTNKGTKQQKKTKTSRVGISSHKRSYTPPSVDKVSRLEHLVEKLIQHQAKSKIRHQHVYAKPECIPEFMPGNPNLSSTKWIEKIEQLGGINRWDEQTTIYYMQSRLGGLARQWYDNLPSYQLTWIQWKELLIKSYPEHQDFAANLRTLVNRFKEPDETWSRYYFDKMELVNACEITNKKAVSCVIDGIRNQSIQVAAKTGRYEIPDALYADYLSTLKPKNWMVHPEHLTTSRYPVFLIATKIKILLLITHVIPLNSTNLRFKIIVKDGTLNKVN
ncbi:hypothetical protein RN001_006637 [Aquatica leii]|uniref:Retrotransposon gag domain-containing protein n=1 Tax=Aquatica leii TaxID=1421715 RepID=A0AAN7SQA3_9COLE|nr:hypothetical protein RN001_006637 [Aquatica leii]